MLDIDVQGETLTLLPTRAIYWARTRTLFAADLHLGKTATFRAFGVPLPEGDTSDDLDRLTITLKVTDAQRLVILGDFIHGSKGRDEPTLAAFSAWRDKHAALPIDLVRGNHDRRAGDPPAAWNIRVTNPPVREFPFVFGHEPFVPKDAYALTGHLHPAALLTGKGRQSLKLPCFWFGARTAVLPAFGAFTGLAQIQAQRGDRVFVIAGNQVMRI